jgi:hypothetical protein
LKIKERSGEGGAKKARSIFVRQGCIGGFLFGRENKWYLEIC